MAGQSGPGCVGLVEAAMTSVSWVAEGVVGASEGSGGFHLSGSEGAGTPEGPPESARLLPGELMGFLLLRLRLGRGRVWR